MLWLVADWSKLLCTGELEVIIHIIHAILFGRVLSKNQPPPAYTHKYKINFHVNRSYLT